MSPFAAVNVAVPVDGSVGKVDRHHDVFRVPAEIRSGAPRLLPSELRPVGGEVTTVSSALTVPLNGVSAATALVSILRQRHRCSSNHCKKQRTTNLHFGFPLCVMIRGQPSLTLVTIATRRIRSDATALPQTRRSRWCLFRPASRRADGVPRLDFVRRRFQGERSPTPAFFSWTQSVERCMPRASAML